jgi:hypothetical protein
MKIRILCHSVCYRPLNQWNYRSRVSLETHCSHIFLSSHPADSNKSLPPAYVRDILKYIKCFLGSKIIASKCHSKRVFQPPRVSVSAMNTKWSYTLSVLTYMKRFMAVRLLQPFLSCPEVMFSKELQIVTGVKFLTSWPCASYTNLQALHNNT